MGFFSTFNCYFLDIIFISYALLLWIKCTKNRFWATEFALADFEFPYSMIFLWWMNYYSKAHLLADCKSNFFVFFNKYWDNKWKYTEHDRHDSSLTVWKRRRKLPSRIIINSDVCCSEEKANGWDGEQWGNVGTIWVVKVPCLRRSHMSRDWINERGWACQVAKWPRGQRVQWPQDRKD